MYCLLKHFLLFNQQNEQLPLISIHWTKINTMTCADGNLGPGLEQAQKNGSVKSLIGSLLY
jgi:hypothetical protein